jgi:hypothetical protein
MEEQKWEKEQAEAKEHGNGDTVIGNHKEKEESIMGCNVSNCDWTCHYWGRTGGTSTHSTFRRLGLLVLGNDN